ncbi:MAG: glycosyltransferase family 4 protein [Deltaproteobacteria bacterium]|nr:glycosyltransferase family 4 protein [Deltaproteobacteria bacterium]
MSLPRTAFLSLWFPKPSETFVFREVTGLIERGLPLSVFTLYGELTRGLSPEMAAYSDQVERLGLPYLAGAAGEVLYWHKRRPALVRRLWGEVPFRRWSSLEQAGENLWAFLCGFRLARRFEEERMGHIHAAWAGGPATAAWVAARLSGLPFSFSARAGDIHPPDGALIEKIRDCAYVRANNKANLAYLQGLAGQYGPKIKMVYNPLSLAPRPPAPVKRQPPYRLLALGRFARTKGYDVLLKACGRLKDQGLNFRLTLAGEGPWGRRLKSLARRLKIEERVEFPGFIRHDRVSELMAGADLFIMPSVVHQKTGDKDGIPNVIMEALIHRLPVVASDVSGIGEVIRQGETGRLVPPQDSQALAQAIEEEMADRARSLAMAEQGRELVLARFDPKRNTEALLNLIIEHALEPER